MSVRASVVIGLATVSGLSAAVGVSKMRPTAAAPAKIETTTVLVAKKDISLGMPVLEDDLTAKEWPKAQVPDGVITDKATALGRSAKIKILEGDLLLEKKLAAEGEGRGMAPLVRPGMRAFTVPTPTVGSGVAGFVLPGNRVDVFLTVTDSGRNEITGGGSTTLLLQNVEVIGVDSQIERPEEHQAGQVKSVTLMVSPREASMLSMAEKKGTLNLALRNDGDIEQAGGAAVTFNDVRWAYGRPEGEPNELLMEEPAAEGKSTLAALAEMATAMMAASPEKASSPEELEPPKPIRVRIRTLRGISPGEVQIDLPQREKGAAIAATPVPSL